MRICSGAGCLRAIDDDKRLCDECQAERDGIVHDSDGIRSHTLTDRERYAALYKSHRWQAIRAHALRREPWCSRCGVAMSEIGDHRVPAGVVIVQAQLSGLYKMDRYAGFYFKSNIQGLCRACHWIKTAEDKGHVGPWPDAVAIERATPKPRYSF